MHCLKRPLCSLFAAMLLFSLSAAGSAQAVTPNNLSDLHMGFRGIAWGQSPDEVKAKGIKFGEYITQGKIMNAPVVSGTALDIEGVPVIMAYSFADGKFAGISMIPVDPLRAVQLVATYIKLFGEPVFQDLKAQKHVWQDATVTIVLQSLNGKVTLSIVNNALFAKAGSPTPDMIGGSVPKS